ncbi:MAG: GTPase/DUF3482 domain-containing protein [Candidatus Competibacteraceae bacterium]|nr:GTPase/DUF3482 domain-containing protein [Candidatus Competibacteraceae bacterium]
MKQLPTIKVAVVGHTNTGKTSLLRTLTRDVAFGEVSNRAATTRHVEGTALLVNGQPLIELYDTPGLEDSIGLLELLDSLGEGRRMNGIEEIHRFLATPEAAGEFEQEAKSLRQLLSCHCALYVIDARDRVLGKHQDELEILGRSAKPVVPVLNFVASPEARTAQWREHLARVNMHAVVEFDTVVINEHGERRLFEKMQTLLDAFRPTLEAVIEDHERQRANLTRAAADLLADLFLDVAAYRVMVPAEQPGQNPAAVESLKDRVRERERHCVNDLLELFRFRIDDYMAEAIPVEGGEWGLDLFSPAALRQFGIRAGGGAAAGAMAGLTVDAMLGGASLGAGAAIGAAFGALFTTARNQGRRIAGRLRGFTELRVDQPTLRLLLARQMELVQVLLRRGHASQEKIRLDVKRAGDQQRQTAEHLPELIDQARINPHWSRLNQNGGDWEPDSGREETQQQLAVLIAGALAEVAGR